MTAASTPRVTAPFGSRQAVITPAIRARRLRRRDLRRSRGPWPRAGQFYMLRSARRWGGGEAERPFLPRAFSVLRAAADGDGALELQFLLEDVGPGTNRLCELGRGEALELVGPLGNGFTAPRDGRRALLVGGGVGIAPLAIWQDQLGSPRRRGAGLSRRRPRRRGRAARGRPGGHRRRQPSATTGW